jgi:hypothetical protein
VKKKWPIHILPMLLCLVMLFNIPAYAEEARASDRIVRTTVTLSKKSNGDLSIFFSVQANDIMEKIGASSVSIQRSTGSGWVTEYTFNTSNTPTLQQENKAQYGTVLTYSPRFTGVDYRAVVKIYVTDALGVSTQTLTSKTVAI